ncbi:MAG: Flp pilus assembly protein CpaB [Caldilineaceae bacterium]|nr:Flp pilus assembly protein CpaB [Caldilineaceae bacterium]
MKLSGILWWVGAFVSAALAGVLTFSLLRPVAPVAAKPALVTRPVVVAAADIPFRRSISAAELVVRDLPTESVPEGAAIHIEQVVGKMSTVPLYTNAPILVQQLVTPDIVTQQVSLSIERGKVVMAVPTQSRLISSRLMRPGDRIDLLATMEVEVVRPQGSGTLANTIALLQNLEIHAIILPPAMMASGSSSPAESIGGVQTKDEGGVFYTPDKEAQSVLLAVNTQDALAILHILNVGGRLDIALRAPDDDGAQDPIPVDQFYLADRYKIDLVR